MVNYVCIGKGTTDENGVAHITHDCNGNPLTSEPGYKGSGAGETLIVASLDKPVVSESVLSNVLSVSDVDNYSLILTADKSIIQSSETSVLSATLKNNNIPVAGKTIEFASEKVLKTLVGSGQTGSYGYLDDDYYLTVDDNCNYVAMGSSTGNWLKITPSTILLNGNSPSYSYDNDYPIHVKNGILTYVDSNGDDQTVDVSNYNPLKALLFQTGCTFRWYSLYGVTDSTGVASVNYVGTGAGLQSVTAKYGTIVSEPFPVIDATFYDRGTSTDYSAWRNSDFTGSGLQRGDDYTTLTPQDTYDECDIALSGDFCIEFDINITYTASNTNIMRFTKNRWTSVAYETEASLGLSNGVWSHVKFSKTDNTIAVTVDGQTKTPITLSDTIDTFMIALNNTQVTNLKYKNFVVYPI